MSEQGKADLLSYHLFLTGWDENQVPVKPRISNTASLLQRTHSDHELRAYQAAPNNHSKILQKGEKNRTKLDWKQLVKI